MRRHVAVTSTSSFDAESPAVSNERRTHVSDSQNPFRRYHITFLRHVPVSRPEIPSATPAGQFAIREWLAFYHFTALVRARRRDGHDEPRQRDAEAAPAPGAVVTFHDDRGAARHSTTAMWAAGDIVYLCAAEQ